MPNIFVMLSSYETVAEDLTKAFIQGRSIASGVTGDIGFGVTVNISDNSTQLNSAMIQAAVTEWAQHNPPIIVTGGDKKVLFCGAL